MINFSSPAGCCDLIFDPGSAPQLVICKVEPGSEGLPYQYDVNGFIVTVSVGSCLKVGPYVAGTPVSVQEILPFNQSLIAIDVTGPAKDVVKDFFTATVTFVPTGPGTIRLVFTNEVSPD